MYWYSLSRCKSKFYQNYKELTVIFIGEKLKIYFYISIFMSTVDIHTSNIHIIMKSNVIYIYMQL